jgi:hypothetical protein
MACKRFDVQNISIYFKDGAEGERTRKELEDDLNSLPENKRPNIKVAHKKYPGRKLKLGNINFLGLEFFQVSLTEEPLLAAIRLADNMDMTYSRFSSLQKEDLFKAYYYTIGDEKNGLFYGSNKDIEKSFEVVKDKEKKLSNFKDAPPALKNLMIKISRGMTTYQVFYEQENKSRVIDKNYIVKTMDANIAILLEQQLNAKEAMGYWRKFIVDRLTWPKGAILIDPAPKSEVRRAATKISSSDSPHFLGCEPVQKVQITKKGIEITVDQDLYDKLNEIMVEEKLTSNGRISIFKIPAGEYQIRRLYEACKNIKLKPEDSGIQIYVNGKNYTPN